MRETVIVVWSVLLLITGMLLMFVLKKKKRKMGKYEMFYKLILFVITLGLSYVLFRNIHFASPAMVWSSRLLVLLLGMLNVWVMFKRPWTIRSNVNYEDDAFLPELIFTVLGSLFCSLAFVLAPQLFEVVDYAVELSYSYWEMPLWFILPFVFLKVLDFSGHIPIKMVENPWIFPLEKIISDKWPWRDLMQVNFEVKKSLLDEYNLFSWSAQPWIEAPKEVSLGKIFQLCIQERRKRSELSTIQDMGDEYGGAPKFCWVFSIKKIWYIPGTWFRNPRYINPNLSLDKNNIKKNDVIIARRISGDGSAFVSTEYNYGDDSDMEKTVIINR